MRGSARRRQDQYYALTAMIAARGSQAMTRRIIAAVLACLGVVALVMVPSPRVTHLPAGSTIAAVLGVCCFGMALLWLRQRWPTRTESKVFVWLGTIGVAIGSLLPPDPIGGLLASTAFVLVATYVALFHTPRMVACTLAVAAATLAYLTVRLAVDDLAVALACLMLIVLLNLTAVFSSRAIVELSGSHDGPATVEPLTGLLTQDCFYDTTATLLASRSRDDDRYLVLAVVSVDSYAAMVSMVGRSGGARAQVTAAQALRENIRRDAIVGHVGDGEYLITDTFTAPDPSPLIERVRGAIASTPAGMTASIGVVCTPLRPLADRPPHDVLDEVRALATTAMYEARRAGGNQARYVLRPSLSVVDDQDTDPDPLI